MRRRSLVLASLFTSFACGGGAPPDGEVPAASVAAPSPPPALAASSFRPAFDVEIAGEPVRQMVVAPSGEVIVATSKTLRVLSSGDGSVMRSAPACSPTSGRALGFSSPKELVLLCSDEVIVFSYPELAAKRGQVGSFGLGAVGPGRIALAERWGSGRVKVFALDGFRFVDWFDAPGRVEAMAFTSDGGGLAVVTDSGIYKREVALRRGGPLYPTERGYSASLSFSPDGRRLFAGLGSSLFEVDWMSGGATRSFEPDSSTGGVAYLSDDLVATTGREGLAIWSGKGGGAPPRVIDKKLNGVLAVAPDATLLCASAEKTVACYRAPSGRVSIPEARWVALPLDAPPPEPPPPSRVPKPPPTSAPEGYTIAWRRFLPSVHWLGIAPDGKSLVVIGRGTLAVHGLEDGAVKKTGAVCSGADDAYGFAKSDRFVVVCENKIQVFEWPSLAEKGSHELGFDMNVGSIGGGKIAVDVEDTARIRLFSIDGKKLDDFETSAVIETIALSPDGSLLAFSPDGGGAEVRDLKKRTMRKLTKGGNGRGLAFSPDGKKLFGTFSEFQAVELDVATGGQQRAWSPPGYLFDAQYLSSGDLVATGHSGLMIFSGSGGKAKAEADWIDRTGIAAVPDASVICGVSSFVGKGRESMDDEIVCFAKKP